MYIYQQMAGASEEYLDNSQVNGNANGNGHHAGDGRTHYLEVRTLLAGCFVNAAVPSCLTLTIVPGRGRAHRQAAHPVQGPHQGL